MTRLALTPDARWDTTPVDLAVEAGAAGFDALGVQGAAVDETVASAHRAAGLGCHELLALLVGDDEAEARRTAEALAAAAVDVGAEWVLSVYRTGLDARVAATVERCAAVFAAADVGMAVEFSPLGPVDSIRTGMEVVRVARRAGGRVGLLIDNWHFVHGPSTWDDLTAVPLDDIAYVQFSDALAPVSSPGAETMHRRTLPGHGVMELDRFAGALLDRGWDGLVSAEILSADLRTRPTAEVVRSIHDTMAPYWR